MVVARLAETVCLPAARHGDGSPRGVGLWYVGLVADSFDDFQLPCAVEALGLRAVGDGQDAAEGVFHLCLAAERQREQQNDGQSFLHGVLPLVVGNVSFLFLSAYSIFL